MRTRLTRLVFDDGSFESVESLRQKGIDIDRIEAALAGKIIQSSAPAPEPAFALEAEPQVTLAPAAADPDKALWQQLRGTWCPCDKQPKARWFFFCSACTSALPVEIIDLLAEIERLTGEAAVPDALADDVPRRYRLALSFLRLQEPALRLSQPQPATP